MTRAGGTRLAPPVLALPPPLDARTCSMSLARVPRGVSRAVLVTVAVVRAPAVVRLVRCVVRAAVAVAVAVPRFVVPRAQHVVAVSGARPPPVGRVS